MARRATVQSGPCLEYLHEGMANASQRTRIHDRQVPLLRLIKFLISPVPKEGDSLERKSMTWTREKKVRLGLPMKRLNWL